MGDVADTNNNDIENAGVDEEEPKEEDDTQVRDLTGDEDDEEEDIQVEEIEDDESLEAQEVLYDDRQRLREATPEDGPYCMGPTRT